VERKTQSVALSMVETRSLAVYVACKMGKNKEVELVVTFLSSRFA
jgi:hypothetical protein